MEANTYILTFPGTGSSIKAEALLTAAGVIPGVMPLPGAIRAGCGIALRVLADKLGAARAVLEDGGIETVVYRKESTVNEYILVI
ncbi:MAG: DUF3343 domain-containing protein [Clostridiales bacterium]|jgi:hypothetical protein|nr:DUF3343 domain-containing protein [Clostridiales bacterium]